MLPINLPSSRYSFPFDLWLRGGRIKLAMQRLSNYSASSFQKDTSLHLLKRASCSRQKRTSPLDEMCLLLSTRHASPLETCLLLTQRYASPLRETCPLLSTGHASPLNETYCHSVKNGPSRPTLIVEFWHKSPPIPFSKVLLYTPPSVP